MHRQKEEEGEKERNLKISEGMGRQSHRKGRKEQNFKLRRRRYGRYYSAILRCAIAEWLWLCVCVCVCDHVCAGICLCMHIHLSVCVCVYWADTNISLL